MRTSTQQWPRRTSVPKPEIRPKASLPRAEAPPGQPSSTPTATEEALGMLASLPRSRLGSVGIKLDMSIPKREANRPVGGCLSLFVNNWVRISQDPWVREAVTGHRLELSALPVQHGIPRSTSMEPAKVALLSKEVEDLATNGAITPCRNDQEGFFSQLFLVPKSDGAWRPVINLKGLNQFIMTQHFKMESVRTVKAIIQKGDWLLKLDLKDAYLSVPIHSDHQRYIPQGRLPLCPHPLGPPEVPEVPLGEQDMAVQGPTIRTQQRTPDVHETPEAGCQHSQEAGHTPDPLSGRHAANGTVQARDKGAPGHCVGTAVCPGVYHKHEEERFHTSQVPGVSRICSGLNHNDHQTAPTETLGSTQEGEPAAPPGEGDSQTTGPTSGDDGGSTPGNSPSPPPLQSVGESEAESPSRSVGLRGTSETGQRDGRRLGVVDELSCQLQWETSADRPMGPEDRVRRFTQGLGGIVPRSIHGRTLDRGGEQAPHKLPGAIGSVPGPADVLGEQGGELSPPPAGQYHSHRLYQQDGGHPLCPPVRACSGDLELVHLQEHNNSCRASSGPRECESRLGITAFNQLERLEVTSGGILPTRIQTRSLLYRFVCVEDQHPATTLLQLESGPRCTGGGRLLNQLEGTPTVPLPSLRSDSQMPQQAGEGEDNCLDDSTSLVESNLVPSTSQLPNRPSHSSAPDSRHRVQPRRDESSPGGEGVPTTSRLVCLRRSCTAQGLSERVTEIIRKSWRTSTESAYNNAWRQWVGWCIEREADPLSAPVKEVLEFLCERFEAGKQYRTINTLRSAISMTHEEVDGVRIGQHPMVARFLKGVYNLRPPAPKYTTTWDVDTVLDYLSNLPDNESLSLQQLSHKLTMLLALTNADRCSDLAALNLSYRTYLGNGVRFLIPGLTKTRSSGPPLESHYPAFPDNQKLCPVSTLRAYEQRTQATRPSSEWERNPLFISVRKPHRPVKPATLGRWLKG